MFKITLSEEQIKVLDKALAELPYREVKPLFDHINKEISEQLKESNEISNSMPEVPEEPIV